MNAQQETWYTWEDDGFKAMARICGWGGVLVTQASLASIAYEVFDLDNHNASTGSGSVTIADAVYDTEQTGSGWPAGYSDGFNFAFLVPGSCFPTGGHYYQVEFRFTPAGSNPQPFSLIFERVFAKRRLGS